MKISVIIPTYNGAEKIMHLLRTLEKQSHSNFETIVVIDGSTDRTGEILKASGIKLQELKIIEHKSKGRAAARNSGAEIAEGELLIFMDDDIEPADNVIELHASHHSQYRDSLLSGCLFMDIRSSNNDFYRYRHHIENQWNAALHPENFQRITLTNYSFTTQNLSVPKTVFSFLHGFDERLNDSEDFDFSVRALKQNISIYYNKDLFAWHRDFAGIEKYIQRQREYKIWRRRLLEIHPEYATFHPQSFSRLRNRPLFKEKVSLLFRYNSFWKSFLASKWFLWLPQMLRYRLYELVIYSSL